MAIIRSHSGRVLLDTTQALIQVGRIPTNTHEFHFRFSGSHYNCPIRGIRIPVYVLEPTTAPNDYQNSFYAYYCDYEADSTRTVQVGQAMDYFFTATLSGCSVGICPQDATGRHWVGHANAMTVTMTINAMLSGASLPVLRQQQQLFQNRMLRNSHQGRMDVYHGPHYGIPEDSVDYLRTTLIGFRERRTGRWSFIRQVYDLAHFV